MVVGGSKGVEAPPQPSSYSFPPRPRKGPKIRNFDTFFSRPLTRRFALPPHGLLPLLRQLACASQPTPSYSFPPRSRKVPETSKPRNPCTFPQIVGFWDKKRQLVGRSRTEQAGRVKRFRSFEVSGTFPPPTSKPRKLFTRPACSFFQLF